MIDRTRMALVLVALVLVLTGAGCSLIPTAADQTSEEMPVEPVVREPLSLVSAEAVIVPRTQADLTFKAMGRVAEVYVEEGDAVVAGQELARLDTRDLEQAVRQAEAEVQSAQAQLAGVRAGARAEEIASAKAMVAIAQAGAKAREMAVSVAQGNVASAQAALSNAEAGVATAEIAVKVAQGNVAAAQAAQRTAEAALQKALAGPTTLELQIAEKQIEAARNELWGLQGQRDALGGMREHGGEAQYEAAQGQVAAGESHVAIALLQYEHLKAGPRQEDIGLAQSQVAEAQAAVQTAVAQRDRALAEVESAKTMVIQAQAGVEIAQAQLEQSKSDVQSAQAQVAQVQAQLDMLEAGNRPEDIAVAEAAVARAEAALGATQNALDDAVLRAPYDGIVGAIFVDAGEVALAQVPAMCMGDLTEFLVETEDLSEVDVSLVRAGQPATVTVDALENSTFSGTVARVAPLAVDRRGDKVYTVALDMGIGPESGLRWGMSAFVEIDVQGPGDAALSEAER